MGETHTIIDLGSLPEWLAAIGTIGATVTALWLARRTDAEHLVFGVGLTDRDLEVYLANVGFRQVHVSDMALHLGRFRPHDYDGIDFVLVQAQQLPLRLDPQETVTLRIGVPLGESYLPDRINRELLRRLFFDRALFLIVTTGQRKRIRYRIPKAVVRELLEKAPPIRN